MITNIMLDLETWGTGNNALIVSLGAVKFNDTDIVDRFHVGIEPSSGQQLGGVIDADTMLWWLDPERDEARKSWLGMERVDLASALAGFAVWIGDPCPIWGNGSTFDNVILRSAYAAAGLDYPSKFWMDRCYRSIKALAPEVVIERVGTHHNALDDAESQAKHLQELLQMFAISLEEMS